MLEYVFALFRSDAPKIPGKEQEELTGAFLIS
jgi:hypothetical protein